MTRPHRASLLVVYATVFLDLLGFGIILPALPFFARQLIVGGGEDSPSLGLGIGLLFMAYSLAQMLGAAILGRLSDRVGRRPVLLLSLSGSAISFFLSGLAQTLLFLCLARALAGLFGGSISTAQAYIADVTTKEERAKYMGMLGASIGLGFVLGPALGAGLISLGFGFAGAAFCASGLAVSNLLFGFWRLREPERHRPLGGVGAPGNWARLLAAWRRPVLAAPLAATFLTTFGFVSMETTFAFLGKARFALDERSFGLILVFAGVVMIVVQGALIGRLTRRFGVRPVAAVGALLMGVALSAIAFVFTLPTAVAALGLLAFSQGLSSPSLSTLLSHASRDDEQGSTLGLGQSMGALARAFGPLLAGALYDVAHGAPYLAASAAALLAAGLVATVGRQAATKAEESG